jgi:hypothetical protein
VFTLPVRDFLMVLGWFDEASICSTVDKLICNQQVVGSNLTAGSSSPKANPQGDSDS